MQSFAYNRPASVAEAVSLVADDGPGARFFAGGTTLYDLMKLDVERPTRIVDVSRLRELRSFDTGGREELVFGAGALMADVAEDPVLVSRYPALAESLSLAASQQLRNMATVGGNLLQRTRCAYFRGGDPFPCNKRVPGTGCSAVAGLNRNHAVLGGSDSCVAVYPGDWAVALAAFDAAVDVIGPGGERTVPLLELHREPGDSPQVDTTLGQDELIVRIRVPTTSRGGASTYRKIRDRESYAFALASAAVAITLEGNRVTDARIALGGVATRPWRASAAERQLAGTELTPDRALEIGRAAFDGARPLSHNAYKVELGANVVADALLAAKDRA